jgi:hypothetical protein
MPHLCWGIAPRAPRICVSGQYTKLALWSQSLCAAFEVALNRSRKSSDLRLGEEGMALLQGVAALEAPGPEERSERHLGGGTGG